MPVAWRIVPKERWFSAFDGEGARRFGGRWNSEGVPMVYTASSRALACLETLVHLPSPPPRREYVIIQARLPEQYIEKFPIYQVEDLATLEMQRLLTRSIGDRFIQKGLACAMEVPSVIVPGETNYLINPKHADFAKAEIGSPEPFAFDARLLSARKLV